MQPGGNGTCSCSRRSRPSPTRRAGSSTRSASATSIIDETRSRSREVSVLFAGLQVFTSVSERSDATGVSTMLNEYFGATVAMSANRYGGVVDKLIGDAIMVTYNTPGDQPDHALRVVRAGLALQRETGRVGCHPEWPRFRVSVNSGDVMVGPIGAEGRRGFTVIGDTVNLASRLEGKKARVEAYGVGLPPDGS